jgi:hypothetical protein
MKLFVALLLAIPAFGSNAVVVTDLTGSTQTNRPISTSRLFTQGEIANFAQPSVSGTPLTTWQCDVKSRWTDGSLKHAIISYTRSFTANQSITVLFVNNVNPSSAGNQTATDAAGLDQTAMLAFNPGTGASTWGAEIQATNGSTQTANVRTMMAAGNWRYWLRGPVVTQAIVEDRSGRTYDFGWTCSNCSSTNYSSATWSVAGTSAGKSLHPIFVATFYTGWSGVKIESILEDPWTDRLADQYYSLAIKTHSDLSTTAYTKSSFGHNAGSRWRRVYWDGTTPGGMNTDFNFAYLTASKAIPNFDTSRVVGCCGANTAGGLEIAAFKATMGDGGTSFATANAENVSSLREIGQWDPHTPSSGGRGEIGPLPRWDVRWLYTQNDSMFRVMLGNATAATWAPFHIREHRSDNKYLSTAAEPGQTTLAQGRGLSVDARPTGFFQHIYAGTGNDPITLAGTVKCGDAGFDNDTGICSAQFSADPNATSWVFDQAHQSQMGYIPYLVTGDYFWLEELYLLASFAVYEDDPGTCYYCRDGAQGIINEFPHNTRGGAWPLRNTMIAGFIAPDSHPEKLYFQEKVNHTLAAKEGFFNVTTGHFNGSTAWTFGNTTMRSANVATFSGSSSNNPIPLMGELDSGFEADPCTANTDCTDRFVSSTVSFYSSPWMDNYMHLVTGWAGELGYQSDAVNAAAYRSVIQMVQERSTGAYFYNPYLIGAYRMPALNISHNWFTTMPSLFAAWNSTYQNLTDWPDAAQAAPTNIDHAYDKIALAASTFMVNYRAGSLLGLNSFMWLKLHATFQSQFGANTANCAGSGWTIDQCDDPKWAILPRYNAYTAGTTWAPVGDNSTTGWQDWSDIVFREDPSTPGNVCAFAGSSIGAAASDSRKGVWRNCNSGFTGTWTRIMGAGLTNPRARYLTFNNDGDLVVNGDVAGVNTYVIQNPFATTPTVVLATGTPGSNALYGMGQWAGNLFSIDSNTNPRTVYRTTDKGYTWATFTTLAPPAAIAAFWQQPTEACIWSFTEADYSRKSCDGFATTTAVGRLPNAGSAITLHSGTVLGADVDNYPRKWDGVATTSLTDWVRWDNGLNQTNGFAPGYFWQDLQDTTYVCGRNFNGTNRLAPAVWKTTDDGANWSAFSTGLTQPLDTMSGPCRVNPYDGYLYVGTRQRFAAATADFGTTSGLFRIAVQPPILGAATTAPTITTSCPLPSGTQSVAYSQSMTASGDTPITWDLSTGSLPTGLSLSSGGSLTGTPSSVGTASFTLRATNTVGNNTLSCSLFIAATATGSGSLRSGSSIVNSRVITQ